MNSNSNLRTSKQKILFTFFCIFFASVFFFLVSPKSANLDPANWLVTASSGFSFLVIKDVSGYDQNGNDDQNDDGCGDQPRSSRMLATTFEDVGVVPTMFCASLLDVGSNTT